MREIPSGLHSRKKRQEIETTLWHTAHIRVQVADTDYGGGVYHGRYFNLFHQARDCFWEDLGVSTLSLKQQGLDLTVAELHTSFLASVYYGDRLDVRTRVVWYREKSMGVTQEIMGTSPDSEISTLRCRTEMNLVSTTRGKAVPLPDHLIQAITSFYGI